MSKHDPRRRSSRSWFLPPSERRELYIARNLPEAVEALITWAIAAGADSVTGERRDELELLMARIMNASWSDGGAGMADLRTARDAEKRLRMIMELELRKAGLPVPTDPIPSEPPPDQS